MLPYVAQFPLYQMFHIDYEIVNTPLDNGSVNNDVIINNTNYVVDITTMGVPLFFSVCVKHAKRNPFGVA